MKRTVIMPSVALLRAHFSYDARSGVVLRTKDGKQVGYLNNIGYRQVAFKGRIYSVHRLIWAIHHGQSPDGEVDHINGDRSDNRICNLRLASSSQNNQNRRLSSRNKSGVKGVFRTKWKKSGCDFAWRVAIGHSRGEYYITHFQCFGQAVRHSKEMRSKLHKEFANLGAAS
jgi:hypothetical protein